MDLKYLCPPLVGKCFTVYRLTFFICQFLDILSGSVLSIEHGAPDVEKQSFYAFHFTLLRRPPIDGESRLRS